MDSQIIVALISLCGVVISALISSAVASKTASSKFSEEIAVLKIQIKNIEDKMDTVDEHLREHNHYSQLFNENIPVIKEKLKVTEHRLEDLEHERSNN